MTRHQPTGSPALQGGEDVTPLPDRQDDGGNTAASDHMNGMASRTRTRHRRNLDNARARSRAAGPPPEDIDVMAHLRASAERGSDRARHLLDVFEGIVSELQAADPEAVDDLDDSCKSCLIAEATDGRLCDECRDTLCRRCEAFLDSGDLPGGLCTVCRPNDLEGGTSA